jgi:hypothetical protein
MLTGQERDIKSIFIFYNGNDHFEIITNPELIV